MLKIVFVRVREEKLDLLKGWIEELKRREDEVLETFEQEGTRHERAYLLEGKEGPVLVYAMEMEDPERARRAYQESELPIDLEHREVMRKVTAGPVQVEQLLDLHT